MVGHSQLGTALVSENGKEISSEILVDNQIFPWEKQY